MLPTQLQAAGISEDTIPLRGGCNPLAVWRLRRLLARVGPRIVHAWGLRANSLGRLAGGARCAAWLTTIRALGVAEDAPSRWALHRLRRSDRVIVPCETVRKTLVAARIAESRIVVIPPAVEDANDSPVDSGGFAVESTELPPELARQESQLIVVVGTTDRRHGTYDLMHAFDIMAINWPNLHLVFAGAGPMGCAAEARARHYRAGDRIHFLGWREDVPHLLDRATAVWHADRWEGISQALLEALAAGLPVVARETNSLHEFLTHGETGLLASPERIMTWCKWQQQLLDEPETAARIGRAGRELVRARFDANSFVARHAELYRTFGGS